MHVTHVFPTCFHPFTADLRKAYANRIYGCFNRNNRWDLTVR